jgi:hypothetical protein
MRFREAAREFHDEVAVDHVVFERTVRTKQCHCRAIGDRK